MQKVLTVLGVVVGFLLGAAYVYWEVFGELDAANWGTFSDWAMILVTIILTVIAAHLPEAIRSRTADLENMRFTKAVLNEYVTTRSDLIEIFTAFNNQDTARINRATVRMSDLYETTRSEAPKFRSFTDLEELRNKALVCNGYIQNAVSCWNPAYQTVENRRALEQNIRMLGHWRQAFCDDYDKIWARHVMPLLNSDE